ncbi:MAG: hypothetical protein FWB84_07940 [Candidatus Bathyarchaeota archaeon]|uniref:hypothetical protein n=1 Tax=Candidatus Bathycorpusculum sp. TaxID=2994959 RepID=UPI00282A819C|nr:hypothetical protein [Candidatus Termiticorpusculum sp.]MCL2258160.1 hypothetical protein [Candidatus Termiticorpusculum sp.]MCL2291548.1 hypothetical protein [Candidatus Termiticorpusculum sp.]
MKTKRATVLIVALAMLCVVAAVSFVSAATTSTATFYSFYNGYSANISYITGARDGKYAEIIGPAANDGGQVECNLSGSSSGTVTSYAKGSGEITIYVKNTSGGYNQVLAGTLNTAERQLTSSSAGFSFNEVRVAVRSPSTGCHGYIDCVITP